MRNWLRKIREEQGLSQEKVAEKIGITRQYYNLIETGKRGNPMGVPTAKRIAEALGFDWTKFFEDGNKTPT